jgi:predicted ATP-grasp superfamily ATP-dependent carboligase
VAPSLTVGDDVQAALARHEEAVATVRAFAKRSGAQRVVLLVDVGDGEATMLDCAPGG